MAIGRVLRAGPRALPEQSKTRSPQRAATQSPCHVVLAAATVLIAAQVQPQLFALLDDHVGDGSGRLPRALTMASLWASDR